MRVSHRYRLTLAGIKSLVFTSVGLPGAGIIFGPSRSVGQVLPVMRPIWI
jgi:hypothetical protein